MFYLRLAITALRSLDTHFLRSLLATLGVLIGVSSVVACMSILEGFSNELANKFKSLGSNLVYVNPQTAYVEGRPLGAAQTLTLGDAEALMRELGDQIEAVAPEAIGTATLKRFQKSDTYTIISTSEHYFQVHSYQARTGRVFSRDETNDEASTVVCLGNKVAEEFFGGMDAVGQSLKLNGVPYRVVGVLEKKGSLGFLNVDECVFMPIKAGLKRFLNRDWLNRLTISVADANRMPEIEKEIRRILRLRHRSTLGQPDDFKVQNQEESLDNLNQIMMFYKVVFYSIAGISLVVGGIGIMNIMLVSVTERTREIGVRMAVGARRSDILLQFLIEGLIISLLGGGFGLLLGAMFADLLNKVIEGFFKTDITTVVIVTAVLTSTIVGVVSGLYPAFKASRLDPVEALRYE